MTEQYIYPEDFQHALDSHVAIHRGNIFSDAAAYHIALDNMDALFDTCVGQDGDKTIKQRLSMWQDMLHLVEDSPKMRLARGLFWSLSWLFAEETAEEGFAEWPWTKMTRILTEAYEEASKDYLQREHGMKGDNA